MDMYHKEALRQLGESIKMSGEIIATVSQWPESERHAKDAHIIGAVANATRTGSMVRMLREEQDDLESAVVGSLIRSARAGVI